MEYLQYSQFMGVEKSMKSSFKPYYKWNTFNTEKHAKQKFLNKCVLNLIISGIPSIPVSYVGVMDENFVLNLIISGIPSIHMLDPIV